MSPDLPWLARNWRAFAYCASLARFSLLVLMATAVLLLVAQGQDLLLSIAEDARYVWFACSVSIWAFSIWLWARILLDIQFPEPPVDLRLYNFWRRHLPRALGALAFGVVALACSNNRETATLAWIAFIAGILFWVLVAKRRSAARGLARRMARARPEAHWLWVEPIGTADLPPHVHLRGALHGVRGWIGIASFLLGIGLFLAGWLRPVGLGTFLGALMLLMLWGAAWLPIGSLISYAGNKSGVPILSLLLLSAVVFSNWNDNHDIRRAASGISPSERLTVDAALQQWRAQHCRGDVCPSLLVVATAGGGIRAAYWTATVLGRIHDSIPAFADHLFAISGVSGGSVGATLYRATIAAAPSEGSQCALTLEGCLQQILARDFLGPVTAALLYPDFLQRFLPIALLPDRGSALEQALERAFNQVTGGSQFLAQPLGRLQELDGRPWPALFLNATWVGNGRRIVASNLRFAEQSGLSDAPFRRSNDQLAEIGYDLRLSTAAHNSARFPLVSPPGLWRDAAGEPQGRLQDGGLFENYGAETALELLEAICRQFTCSNDTVSFPSEQYPHLTPIVVLISSDPTAPANLAASPQNRPIAFGPEIRATFRSFARTRVGRGAEAATRLEDWAREHGRFASFRMCRPPPDQEEPPLGWALSKAAQRVIKGYLGATPCPGNNEALVNIQQWLKR